MNAPTVAVVGAGIGGLTAAVALRARGIDVEDVTLLEAPGEDELPLIISVDDHKVAHDLFSAAGMNARDCSLVLRGNAIRAYGLERFGITE